MSGDRRTHHRGQCEQRSPLQVSLPVIQRLDVGGANSPTGRGVGLWDNNIGQGGTFLRLLPTGLDRVTFNV